MASGRQAIPYCPTAPIRRRALSAGRIDRDITDRGVGNRFLIAGDARLTGSIHVEGHDNVIELGAGTVVGPDDPLRPGPVLEIHGSRNQVTIGTRALVQMQVKLDGDDCRLHIDADCNLTFNANLRAGGSIHVGQGTTMVKGSLQVHETGSITIGKDCMISTLVYLSVSDIHPIYDRETGERLNPAASVRIGDHVWLGLRSMILKGADIGAGAVVAAAAVVSGQVPPNSIVAGTPARVVRENVEWRRDF